MLKNPYIIYRGIIGEKMEQKIEITTNTKVFLPKKRATWIEVQEQRMKRQEKEIQKNNFKSTLNMGLQNPPKRMLPQSNEVEAYLEKLRAEKIQKPWKPLQELNTKSPFRFLDYFGKVEKQKGILGKFFDFAKGFIKRIK